MNKKLQLIIIAIAALAATPAFPATTCNADVCPVKPWREFRTENDNRDYLRDMTAAQSKCKDAADKDGCIKDEMEAKGWRQPHK